MTLAGGKGPKPFSLHSGANQNRRQSAQDIPLLEPSEEHGINHDATNQLNYGFEFMTYFCIFWVMLRSIVTGIFRFTGISLNGLETLVGDVALSRNRESKLFSLPGTESFSLPPIVQHRYPP
jgi:hypothetical protein